MSRRISGVGYQGPEAMTRTPHVLAPVALILGLLPLAVSAQEIPPGCEDFRHATMLSGSVGVSADSERGGVSSAGIIGWQLTPRMAIAGGGEYFDRGTGTNAFATVFRLQFDLPASSRVRPLVEAGGGWYRATFTLPTTVQVPDFYRRRMQDVGLPAVMTFTDPLLMGGAGINLRVTRDFSVRPGLEALFVYRNGRNYVMTTGSLMFVYRFEEHPVTPSVIR
jgi:hypothetical protein